MQGPEKNSYNEFDNEKKFLQLENSPPPPITFLMVRPLVSNNSCSETKTRTTNYLSNWQDLTCIWFARLFLRTHFFSVVEQQVPSLNFKVHDEIERVGRSKIKVSLKFEVI